MRIKTVDIARELGISKATVSLALNGKPGVSAQTRERILEYVRRMERGESGIKKTAEESKAPVPASDTDSVLKTMGVPGNGAQIKVIYATHGFRSAYKGEIDLSTVVLQTFALCAKKGGYSASISVNDFRETTILEIIRECSEDSVKGIILHATEMKDEEIEVFEQIQKPMVIYDNQSPQNRRSCVVAANEQSICRAVDYLAERGAEKIAYLAHGDSIYNFEKRRSGYREAMQKKGFSGARIITLGTATEEIYQNMRELLDKEPPAQAYIMENYQISVGVVRALLEKGIRIPGQVSLIGVDEIPAYMTGNIRLTFVAVPHAERARMAMILLMDEMEKESLFKSALYMDCPIHPGNSTV